MGMISKAQGYKLRADHKKYMSIYNKEGDYVGERMVYINKAEKSMVYINKTNHVVKLAPIKDDRGNWVMVEYEVISSYY